MQHGGRVRVAWTVNEVQSLYLVGSRGTQKKNTENVTRIQRHRFHSHLVIVCVLIV